MSVTEKADRIEVRIGGGFLGTLCLIFITMKLMHFIDWSWWWILAPVLWPIYLIYYLVIVAFWVLMVAGVLAIIVAFVHRK